MAGDTDTGPVDSATTSDGAGALLERVSQQLRSLAQGRRLLLVQPGNKRTMRRGLRRRPSNTKWWPETRWAAVLEALARMHPKAAILMLGVPQEYDLNEQIIALAGTSNAVNLACDLPVRRLVALQARASAMISVDTGPAHSAAAVGCPVLVLFGPSNAPPTRPDPDTGPDAVEDMLAGLGLHFSRQTVLFNAETKSFGQRRSGLVIGGVSAEIPSLRLDEWAPGTGLPPSNECATVIAPSRLRKSCRSRDTARIAITSEAAVMSKPDSRG